MPPYQVGRVVDWIHGKTTSKKDKDGKVTVTKSGLGKNLPRSVVTEVERYLRERETDQEWFDTCVLLARSSLKRLYALLRLKPSPYAQAVLFDRKPPEGSRLAVFKQLAAAATPADQAKLIVEHKVPYRLATTVISAMTPTVLLALVQVMTPQELISNLGGLKRRGALDNPEIKAAVDTKLVEAKKSKRVAGLKAQEAIKVADLDEGTKAALEGVADAQMKSKGRIKRPTAVFIDKSGSMGASIEAGKRLCAMVSAIAAADLHVYAFDTMAYPIVPKSDKPELKDWEAAMRGINANGGTAIGVALRNMASLGQKVEQIVIVSDGGETSQPNFSEAYNQYASRFGVRPSVGLLHVAGDTNVLVSNCQRNGIEVDVWEVGPATDYYSIPGLIKFLTAGSKMDLLMTIMNWEIPKRRSA